MQICPQGTACDTRIPMWWMTTFPGGLDEAVDAHALQRPSAMLLVALPGLRAKTSHEFDLGMGLVDG